MEDVHKAVIRNWPAASRLRNRAYICADEGWAVRSSQFLWAVGSSERLDSLGGRLLLVVGSSRFLWASGSSWRLDSLGSSLSGRSVPLSSSGLLLVQSPIGSWRAQ